jgi:protocatechuate 3,4-dioxygenase beta subunit
VPGSIWLTLGLALSLLLAACGSSTANPVAPIAPRPIDAPPPSTVLVPTQASAQPAPTLSTPTEPASTPTAAAQALPPALNCSAGIKLTPSQTEGPYYKPNTPERTSLIEPGMSGTQLIVTGYVLNADCKPIAGAWLDVWQANDKGEYDNTGYTLRGHQFTDASGRYYLETIIPGLYPGRTEHIHVKVQAPNQPILTTQLYFPDVPGNDRDGIFSPDLIVSLQDTTNGKVATFNFVLDVQ